MNNIYNISVNKINGTSVRLSDYKGKALLMVNVASQCGLTPQYEALEKIYEQYHDKGFEVLGFPANEFEAQEPGTNAEIYDFCVTKFGVKFPMFEKIVVKGDGQHPLYRLLTEKKPHAQTVNGNTFEEKLKTYGITRLNPSDILWNFEKFLINKAGEVVARFAPDVSPDNALVVQTIERVLAE